MAKKYTGSQALLTFMQIVQTELGKKVSVADLITSLENYDSTNDANKAVAASVVEELKSSLDSFVNGEDGKVTADYLGTLTVDDFVKVTDIAASLDAITDDNKATVVASGAVAKELDDKIANIVSSLDGLTGTEGKVAGADDADKLGGEEPSYYATAESVTSLSGTVDDLSNTVDELSKTLEETYETKETVKGISDTVDEIKDNYMTSDDIADTYATKQSVSDLSDTVDSVKENYVAKSDILDGNGIIDSSVLPSYVDDVVEGYLVTSDDGTLTFYEDEGHGTEIEGETGKIYIDITPGSNISYRYSGSTYVQITSTDMVELTSDEIQAIWDEVSAEDSES
jgi:vacuolar-type H+-ATPase subunit I/STV1